MIQLARRSVLATRLTASVRERLLAGERVVLDRQ